jgi:hypothetical protein
MTPRRRTGSEAWTSIVLAVALSAASSGSAAPAPDSNPEVATQTRQFAEAVTNASRLDPRSPATLNGRLDFASFLAQTAGGDCAARVDDAQQQLDLVSAMPGVDVTLPFGPARLADVDFQIHRARAACGADSDTRELELRLAVESARRAVALYRDALDYKAMAVMQFNAAAALHELGETAGASAELQAAIEFDREFGFEADARDNGQRLVSWSGDAAGASRAAALMKDFPHRTVALVFGWSALDVSVALEAQHAAVLGGRVAHSKSAMTAERQIREHGSSWTLSAVTDKATPSLDPAASPAMTQWQLITLFARARTQSPAIDVSRSGEFRDVLDLAKFASGLESDTQAQLTELLKDANAGAPPPRLESETKSALAPAVIAAKAAEQYNLESGAWIGATLEQGVWYEMAAVLTMPGTPDGVIRHALKFAYTRSLPCTDDTLVARCAEIVIWATPDPEALNSALLAATRQLKLAPGRKVTYSSATYLRLITDPSTLLPRLSDTRRYSYMTVGDSSPEHVLVESERVTARSSYRPAASH